ncbi:MAG TPA: PIG-L family deacetylase, partial [Acidobacteriaceae bacterium]
MEEVEAQRRERRQAESISRIESKPSGWRSRRSLRLSPRATGLLLALSAAMPLSMSAQAVPWATSLKPSVDADPLPEDRGAAGLAQTLNKLRTWASLMMIVAHPDDEDGGMMTLESRGVGARTALFTLTRGEGGQNAMSADQYDALGLIRTNELLRADAYSGTEQYWGRFADYGFSKTKEEALAQWGHDRVLYDVVRAVRINRPLVLTSVFIGGITDGHGHHQVAGEMAQEAFLAAGDPSVFPDQIAAGLRPWKPLAVYARAPFAPVTSRGMYDYATGKWAPSGFYNYVTRQSSTALPSADVQIAEGTFDPVLGRSYLQMAREGWGEQRSQYGGGTPPLAGPNDANYHRYGRNAPAQAVPPPTSASGAPPTAAPASNFFTGMDVSLAGLATLAHGDTAFLTAALRDIDRSVTHAFWGYTPAVPERIAPDLRDGYLKTKALIDAVDASALSPDDKANLDHELAIKLVQFNTALVQALGIEVRALVTATPRTEGGRTENRVLTLYPSATATHVTPSQSFDVRLHVTAAGGWGSGRALQLVRTSLITPGQPAWQVDRLAVPGMDAAVSSVGDALFRVHVPHGAAPTEPYFSRPSVEQAVYDISDPTLLGESFAPYPVSGWAELDYGGVPLRAGQVVQTAHRVLGRGLVYEPLVVTPQISVRLSDTVAVLPAAERSLDVTATVTNEQAEDAAATLTLHLPSGWHAEPAEASLTLAPGEDRAQHFTLLPPPGLKEASVVTASVQSGNDLFTRGFETVGYPGLRPYNLYRGATLQVRPVDVHVTAGLRVGYVMGTGDAVPQAIAQLGLTPHLIDARELQTGDLARYDTIVLGVRTYTALPTLAQGNARLLEWVAAGGTLVVQYQGPEFDRNYGPYPLTLGATAGQASERVVDERAPVRLLAPGDPLLSSPNHIAEADFAGWVEERGHGFAAHWDARYTALTETADQGQDPQQGGLLRAQYGRGQYIYVAYALYRQLPEGVPGAYRLLAN